MKTCFKCKHYTEPWCNALGRPITIEEPDKAAEECTGFYDEDPEKDGLPSGPGRWEFVYVEDDRMNSCVIEACDFLTAADLFRKEHGEDKSFCVAL